MNKERFDSEGSTSLKTIAAVMIEAGDKFTDGDRTYRLCQVARDREARRGSKAGETVTHRLWYLKDVDSGRTGASYVSRFAPLEKADVEPVDETKRLETEYAKLRSRLGFNFSDVFPNWSGIWEDDQLKFEEFVGKYWNNVP